MMNDASYLTKVLIGSDTINLPIYFPSISSVKTKLSLLEYVKILNALYQDGGQYLISAYDIYGLTLKERNDLSQELKKAMGKGIIIAMDSGNYESFWKERKDYWRQGFFHSILAEFPCHFAFCFDEQNPPAEFSRHLEIILDNYNKDQEAANEKTIIPIIHGGIDRLPTMSREVVSRLRVPMIAIPERALGAGIFERVNTIKEIRKELELSCESTGIHLLGTGNPISLALYTLAGANSFDGLEWCQIVVDHESSLLHHFSHGDFYKSQTTWSDLSIPFDECVLAHNLDYYVRWMTQLRVAIKNGSGVEFCKQYFPERVFTQCKEAFIWRKIP